MKLNNFQKSLIKHAEDFRKALATSKGDWSVKGFIDAAKNIYTISADTKVISKIIELMMFPVLKNFAKENNFKMIFCSEQNHYPDVTFVTKNKRKIALDLKSTYRRNSDIVSGFTLGAFTGYFRFRDSKKNITFPYKEYDKHYILGIIYTRREGLIDENKVYSINDLENIISVIKDFDFIVQEKYKIAKDRPGSGNTKNIGILPSTRYQGSKYKILNWIDYFTKDLIFNSVLDAFGGTGCVGYMFKKKGKQIFYNDSLKFNYYIGLALIENESIILNNNDLNFILKKHQEMEYPSFIFDTFHDIYFTDEENRWLDVIITNIRKVKNKYKQALAYYAVFQACIIKRPYNLFHRKNLYIRMAKVKRSFGNKKTWDTPFEEHFLKFVEEANRAVFTNKKKNRVFHSDILNLKAPETDLVYIDSPYISAEGTGVNYFDFYHFLEGIIYYDQWAKLIDEKSKHKKIKNGKNEWCNKHEIYGAFERLFDKFKKSILVVSYRDDGTPSILELVNLLEKYKKTVLVKKLDYKYVLSNGKSKEVLIIAK